MRSRRNLPVLAVAKAAPTTYELPAAQDEGAAGLSIFQILLIMRAYWMHTIIIAVAFIIAIAGVIKLMPKTYTATATLMVNPEGNDPLASNPQMSTPLYNYMSTESQLMMSGEVLLPVIDKLNLTQNKNYAAGYAGDGTTLRDWVKEGLIKNLDIQLGAFGSQLIFINASAGNPQLSAQIANTLAEVYLAQQHDRVSGPASERAKRYAAELAELKDKVRVAQEQVGAFRQRSGVTDTTEKNNNIEQTLLGALEAKLQDAQNLRRAAEVKASAETTQGAATASMQVQNLKGTLNALQTQMAQMLTTYGPEHPKVLELKNQIRAAQANLNAELQNVNSSNSSDLVAARQLEAKMRIAVEEQRTKVLGVNKLQDDGTKYQMELESAQSVYKRALDGYDQIMFASGAHSANISIVSNAVPPQKPAKPNKVKLFIMGILGGIVIGLVAPVLYELFFDRRIRSRDDFERGFNLPVLMEFDPIIGAGSTA